MIQQDEEGAPPPAVSSKAAEEMDGLKQGEKLEISFSAREIQGGQGDSSWQYFVTEKKREYVAAADKARPTEESGESVAMSNTSHPEKNLQPQNRGMAEVVHRNTATFGGSPEEELLADDGASGDDASDDSSIDRDTIDRKVLTLRRLIETNHISDESKEDGAPDVARARPGFGRRSHEAVKGVAQVADAVTAVQRLCAEKPSALPGCERDLARATRWLESQGERAEDHEVHELHLCVVQTATRAYHDDDGASQSSLLSTNALQTVRIPIEGKGTMMESSSLNIGRRAKFKDAHTAASEARQGGLLSCFQKKADPKPCAEPSQHRLIQVFSQENPSRLLGGIDLSLCFFPAGPAVFIFNEYDTNKNGDLSKTEFAAFVQDLRLAGGNIHRLEDNIRHPTRNSLLGSLLGLRAPNEDLLTYVGTNHSLSMWAFRPEMTNQTDATKRDRLLLAVSLIWWSLGINCAGPFILQDVEDGQHWSHELTPLELGLAVVLADSVGQVFLSMFFHLKHSMLVKRLCCAGDGVRVPDLDDVGDFCDEPLRATRTALEWFFKNAGRKLYEWTFVKLPFVACAAFGAYMVFAFFRWRLWNYASNILKTLPSARLLEFFKLATVWGVKVQFGAVQGKLDPAAAADSVDKNRERLLARPPLLDALAAAALPKNFDVEGLEPPPPSSLSHSSSEETAAAPGSARRRGEAEPKKPRSLAELTNKLGKWARREDPWRLAGAIAETERALERAEAEARATQEWTQEQAKAYFGGGDESALVSEHVEGWTRGLLGQQASLQKGREALHGARRELVILRLRHRFGAIVPMWPPPPPAPRERLKRASPRSPQRKKAQGAPAAAAAAPQLAELSVLAPDDAAALVDPAEEGQQSGLPVAGAAWHERVSGFCALLQRTWGDAWDGLRAPFRELNQRCAGMRCGGRRCGDLCTGYCGCCGRGGEDGGEADLPDEETGLVGPSSKFRHGTFEGEVPSEDEAEAAEDPHGHLGIFLTHRDGKWPVGVPATAHSHYPLPFTHELEVELSLSFDNASSSALSNFGAEAPPAGLGGLSAHRLELPDAVWRELVSVLTAGQTYSFPLNPLKEVVHKLNHFDELRAGALEKERTHAVLTREDRYFLNASKGEIQDQLDQVLELGEDGEGGFMGRCFPWEEDE